MHDYNISAAEPKQCINEVPPKGPGKCVFQLWFCFINFFATKIFGQAEERCSSYQGLLHPHFFGDLLYRGSTVYQKCNMWVQYF